MRANILEQLEATAQRVPQKTAFYDDSETLTFEQLQQRAQQIGTALSVHEVQGKPVALLLDARSIRNISAIYGVLYAGGAYAPFDLSMPPERLAQLLALLQPHVILADEKGSQALEKLQQTAGETEQDHSAAELYQGIPLLTYEEAVCTECEEQKLQQIRQKTSVYDPMSILYTSGSTGIPKGSVQTQFAYLHWTEATIEAYGFDETIVFGNQSPFFYANSIIDIFPPVALGATVYLLPSGILNFPKKLIECLNEHQITELTMTPSSFIGVVNAGVLEEGKLPYLRYGIMSGESMPWLPLEIWMKATPNAEWWHFYGSTEMFSVAVGRVEGAPKEGQRIPVGRPFPLAHILFADEDGNEVPAGTPGEMLLSSPWVASGYHRDEVRTQAAWIVDPLQKGWYERFYRSGDIGYLREDGQLVVLGRRDTQIKHMGYRMELGEVEAALRSIAACQEGCVLFQKETGKIWCFYAGELSEKELRKAMKTKLAAYMLPDQFVHLEQMPHTASMKLDREALRKIIE